MTLPYEQFMSNQIVTLAYIIIGILIILGTGKLKEIFGITEEVRSGQERDQVMILAVWHFWLFSH
ncbi:hypothetical protein NKOR_01575 [Candidatus Nitrosopumilus koreensis AR1]|uniref:Uncharacterized protein n=2 Tax=Nitrosopumilaceae TaxID=338190 RepID=K0B6V4_9ARCH|nr:hypothetical protein NKOR_01575 [Candidatus Nitrosopumilus koreensis AR1]